MGKSLKILLFQPLFKDLTKIDSNIILPAKLDAPELDLIRAKYGLREPEFGYHITIGIKPKH